MAYSTQAAFVELYVDELDELDDEDADRVVDLENPPPSEGAQLPCPAAIEFMADVHEARGKEGISEAVKVRPFLTRADVCPIQSDAMHCFVLSALAFPRSHARYRKKKVRGRLAAAAPIE